MKTLIAYLLPALVSFTALATEPALPPPAQRAAMVEKLASEMERIDGEGLIVRDRNRRLSFPQMASRLAAEAREAASWMQLYRVFARLDAAYPNLHAHWAPAGWFRETRVRPELSFAAEVDGRGAAVFRLRNGAHTPMESAPRAGDLVVAVNGKPMAAWSEENLEHCKFPLRTQCDLELFENLRRELLSWSRAQPLTYTLERDGTRFDVAVAVNQSQTGKREEPRCEKDATLYDGYTLAHKGRFACLFTRNGDPGTVIFRISSFQYFRSQESHPIDSPQAEVDALWPWWKAHAPAIRHLILDLASNNGGNEPTPYYEILFERPYQEQWVVFRKIPELLNDPLRKQTLFWGTPQQETWFQNLRREGAWDRTAWGAFLPPVPMFCAGDERSDCRDGLFPVRGHGFKGRVTMLLNHWCVSSCDGFAYEVKEQLGERVTVAGQPQAADTAYSRATIQLHLDESAPGGFRTVIEHVGKGGPQGAFLTQSVSVTRSVLEDGTVVSGLPLAIDRYIDWPFFLDERAWRAYAIKSLP